MSPILINTLLEHLVVPFVLVPFIAWIAARIHQWTGKEVEARHRDALQSALENGVRYAVNLLLERKQPLTMDAITSEAARYVERSVPDAIKHFKLGGRTLHDLLVPKVDLPVLTEQQARDAVGGYTGEIERR